MFTILALIVSTELESRNVIFICQAFLDVSHLIFTYHSNACQARTWMAVISNNVSPPLVPSIVFFLLVKGGLLSNRLRRRGDVFIHWKALSAVARLPKYHGW